MIKINVTGHMYATEAYRQLPTFVPNANNPIIGVRRYNASTLQEEIFDGYGWVTEQPQIINLSLSTPVVNAIEWVLRKMEEEKEIERLSKMVPALTDLLKERAVIDNKIDMVKVLVKEQTNGTS